jgi:hypothetical protein
MIGSADGVGGAALFYNQIGLTADGTGYVVDRLNRTIRKTQYLLLQL